MGSYAKKEGPWRNLSRIGKFYLDLSKKTAHNGNLSFKN